MLLGKVPKGGAKGTKGITGKLTGYTKHGLNQAISRDAGRGVSPRAILNALKNPTRIVKQADGSIKYIGREATVILNQEGKLITTYGQPRNLWVPTQ